jgi:cellulose 1,4-beta-cellobiosidase
VISQKHFDRKLAEAVEQIICAIKESEIRIMNIIDLAAAITAVDTQVNAIADAVKALPSSGSVPQPAVDALNKLTTDLNALAKLVTPVALPAAPTGVGATAGTASVALAWTASPGAANYMVKASTVSGGPYTTLTTALPITSPSFVDTSAKTGVPVFYVVSAVNSAGESPNSLEVTATPA